MEDLFLNVTLAALQDRENGIKTFAKKSVLSKKVKLCFYGAQFGEALRTFGIEDKMKVLEIGQRLLDAGYISPFEAKDRALALQEGSVYFWGEVVVMESKVIEANFTSALNYFLEHPYKRSQSATTSNQTSSSVDETLSKAGTGLLKRLRGLVDEQPAPAPAATATTTMSTRRGEKSQGGSPAPQPATTPTVASLSPTAAAPPQEATGPDTVEEDTDEIKFFLSPDDPNPVVKAATLDKLIERLTYEAYIDMRFRHQFLITYRSFTTPMVLLEKLRERFNSVPATPPTDPTERTEWERQRKLIHLRVLTVLSRWITDLYEDWNDAELRNALSSFLDETPSNVAPLCNQIRALLTKPQNSDSDRWLAETTLGGPTTFSFDDAAVPDIAQQLTAYEFQLFIAIQRDEFLGLKWSKPGKNERAKNVLRYINHFNRVSNWVVREIITCFQLNKRSKLVLKFVQLAFKFREYNNFSSSMCILAALVSSPVRRLKATWAEVPSEWQEKMASLETLFAHNMSYKAYRETIQKLVPPCIPYLGLYLTDLTFIEEANKDKFDTLINFQKRIMISKVIEDIRRFQGVPYKNFTVTNAVKNWLQTLPVFSTDEEAYQLSLKIEPRNAAVTLESMLVEEDRLRKLLHEREIRISDLESENQRLKEQLALLDADLRTQIRRGTDASDDGPPPADGNIARRSGNRSFGRLTLNVSTVPFHKAKPTVASDPAAEAQGLAKEEHVPILKKSSSSEVSAPGSPARSGSRMGERPLNESGLRPLNDSGVRPLNESGVRPLNESGLRALRESPKGDASPPAVTPPGSIGNRNSPARLVLSQDPSSDGCPDGGASAAATPPPVAVSPKRPPPLAAGAAIWSSAPAALPSPTSAEPVPTGSPRGKVLPPSAYAPNPHSISPRERPTPSPYPGFDLPPPDIAPPAPPPGATSPSRSPRDAEGDADAHLRSVADALEKPGNRFGRIVRRQDTSPTPGSEPAPGPPSSGSPSHSQRGVPQVSPASQGKRLPPVPAARKTPSSAAPQLPRFDSTRTGSPAPTQQP